MAYYPKSQIKTNIYSNGQYTLSTTQETYSGPYYEISSGKKYTGKFPGDGKNILLLNIQDNVIPSQNFSQQDFNQSFEENLISPDVTSLNFYNYNSNSFVRLIPTYYSPFPTQKEKDQGYLTRYFCKKGNEYKYIEISKEDFNKLVSKDKSIAWDLYTPTSLKWELANEGLNQSNVRGLEIRLRWVGFSQYVKSLKSFTDSRERKIG